MKKSKKTIVCLVIVGMLLAGTSCSVLDGLLGGSGLIDSVFNKLYFPKLISNDNLIIS